MEKIDKLILKVIELNPAKYHEIVSNKYFIFYDNIIFMFWALENTYSGSGMVSINNSDAYVITYETKKIVLDYFRKKEVDIDKILLNLNKKLRYKKLREINLENENN